MIYPLLSGEGDNSIDFRAPLSCAITLRTRSSLVGSCFDRLRIRGNGLDLFADTEKTVTAVDLLKGIDWNIIKG